MSRFRKRPVEVQAVQYDGENAYAIVTWVGSLTSDMTPILHSKGGSLFIATLEGDMLCSPGDWIIRGVKGEFYPCKPEIFAMTYEPVTPDREDGE